MKEKRKEYEGTLDARLKEWESHIAVFKAKADKAKAETKMNYYKIIQALEHKRDEARTNLQELKTAGDEAWENQKTGVEKVLDAFQTAFHGAAENFK